GRGRPARLAVPPVARQGRGHGRVARVVPGGRWHDGEVLVQAEAHRPQADRGPCGHGQAPLGDVGEPTRARARCDLLLKPSTTTVLIPPYERPPIPGAW